MTCAQSLHHVEPEGTLAEIGRILRVGGVFAAYDYDWPVGPGVVFSLDPTYNVTTRNDALTAWCTDVAATPDPPAIDLGPVIGMYATALSVRLIWLGTRGGALE